MRLSAGRGIRAEMMRDRLFSFKFCSQGLGITSPASPNPHSSMLARGTVRMKQRQEPRDRSHLATLAGPHPPLPLPWTARKGPPSSLVGVLYLGSRVMAAAAAFMPPPASLFLLSSL